MARQKENGPLAETWQDRKSYRTEEREKKRGGRKRQSNDRHEIVDRTVTSDIPGFFSGLWMMKLTKTTVASKKRNRIIAITSPQRRGC